MVVKVFCTLCFINRQPGERDLDRYCSKVVVLDQTIPSSCVGMFVKITASGGSRMSHLSRAWGMWNPSSIAMAGSENSFPYSRTLAHTNGATAI
eukprot:scaffold3084_cov144-Cylindrotheca_fusiformis.AAC.23